MKRFLMSKLVEWKNNANRKPLLLHGARQVGKTTLLKQFGKENFQKVHIFNFEENSALRVFFETNLDPAYLIQELKFHQEKNIDIEHDLIIFDEVQMCPRAITSLKYFQEELPEAYICAAGSLLGVYLAPVSFPVGKVNILNLYPMTFEEFLLALEDHKSLEVLNDFFEKKVELPRAAHDHLWQQLKYYFIVGGLPEAVSLYIQHKDDLFVAFQKVRELQKDLIATYMADIAKHSGPINAMHITRVFESIPSQLLRSQDGSASKYIFKDVAPGIDRYDKLVGPLDWLEKAELVIKVSIVNTGRLPFSAYTDEKFFKLFLFDIGLLGFMAQITPKMILDYDWGSYKGYFVENFVAQAFLASGQSKLYCWKEKDAEVEFLLQNEGTPIPVEVKSGWFKQAKSIKVFVEEYHSPYYIVLSAKYPSLSDKVRRYPLYMAGRIPRSIILG